MPTAWNACCASRSKRGKIRRLQTRRRNAEENHGGKGNALNPPASDSRPPSERAREADLVSVRIDDVEVALAPRGIARGKGRREAGGEGAAMHGVDVIDIEDGAPPPGVNAALPGCFGGDVEMLAAGPEGG